MTGTKLPKANTLCNPQLQLGEQETTKNAAESSQQPEHGLLRIILSYYFSHISQYDDDTDRA